MTAAAERRSPYCAAKATEPARARGPTYTVPSSVRARWPRAYKWATAPGASPPHKLCSVRTGVLPLTKSALW
eukprot:812073-Prymnesium_polylepis.2